MVCMFHQRDDILVCVYLLGNGINKKILQNTMENIKPKTMVTYLSCSLNTEL